jgi:hypothetical protein
LAIAGLIKAKHAKEKIVAARIMLALFENLRVPICELLSIESAFFGLVVISSKGTFKKQI